MATKILLTMPQPGETITEGNIVRWIAKPGDVIQEKQPLVELETEKAVFEYESPYEGILMEILSGDGSTAKVGSPIAVFEVDDSKASMYFMLGVGKEVEAKEKPMPTVTTKPSVTSQKSVQPISGKSSGYALSPFVRRLMQEHGVRLEELSLIKGTGPGGRITKENILHYLAVKEQPSLKSLSGDSGVEIVPCSPIRVRIAENMIESKKLIPHAHTTATVDMTAIIEYRNRIKEEFKKKNGFSLSVLSLLVPSLQKAIKKFPLVNSSFREEGEKKFIAVHKNVNLGMAVDTERGLYIPVLHNFQDMAFGQAAKEMESLVQKAQSNKLSLKDLTGMTFTFNNYGYFGTTVGVQIILPPQAATLGMGRIERRPWIVGDGIQIRWLSEFTLAFDHRVMDGREAGLFIQHLKQEIEDFSEDNLKS